MGSWRFDAAPAQEQRYLRHGGLRVPRIDDGFGIRGSHPGISHRRVAPARDAQFHDRPGRARALLPAGHRNRFVAGTDLRQPGGLPVPRHQGGRYRHTVSPRFRGDQSPLLRAGHGRWRGAPRRGLRTRGRAAARDHLRGALALQRKLRHVPDTLGLRARWVVPGLDDSHSRGPNATRACSQGGGAGRSFDRLSRSRRPLSQHTAAPGVSRYPAGEDRSA